jgi:thymidine kinase
VVLQRLQLTPLWVFLAVNFQDQPMAQLYFYYSAMNAGKSTSLLQSAYNYQERGMTVAIYTAALDNRFGLGKVSSRIGLAMDAHIFDPEFNFTKHAQQQKAQGRLD